MADSPADVNANRDDPAAGQRPVGRKTPNLLFPGIDA